MAGKWNAEDLSSFIFLPSIFLSFPHFEDSHRDEWFSLVNISYLSLPNPGGY